MKQRDLIKKLESIGFKFERHGGNHDIYRRGNDIEKVPRHKEINETLAKAILRKWGMWQWKEYIRLFLHKHKMDF